MATFRGPWLRRVAARSWRLAAWCFHHTLYMFIKDAFGVFFMGISHLHPSTAHLRVTRSKVMKGLGRRHLVANDRGTRRDICILTFFLLQETRAQSENDRVVVEGVPRPTSRLQQDCCQPLKGSGLALSSQILKTFKMEIHRHSGDLSQTAPSACGKLLMLNLILSVPACGCHLAVTEQSCSGLCSCHLSHH